MKMIKTTVMWPVVCLLLSVCCIQAQAQNPVPCTCTLGVCNGSTANHEYSGIAGWGSVLSTPGSMIIGNGVMNYFSTPGANYNRMVGGVNGLINHPLNFIAECKITITGGNSPGHYVMAFTENSDDPVSFNTPGYPTTNNDALAVTLVKQNGNPSSGSCCTNPCLSGEPWWFQIMYKDGSAQPVFTSAGIPVRCQLAVTYYVRLVRSDCWTYLGIYSDPSFTTHVTGSPICTIIPRTVTNFRRLQHGVITWSSVNRTLSMTLDNTKVCPYSSGCSTINCSAEPQPVSRESVTKLLLLPPDESQGSISTSPNPATGIFKLDLSRTDEKISSIAVYDLNGKIHKLFNNVENNTSLLVNSNELPNGVYMIEAYGNTKRWNTKLVIQR